MDTSLKTHHSYVSAVVHRPLLLYSLAKQHVHARFCIVNSAPAQSVRVYNDQWVNEPTPLNSTDFCTKWRIWDNSTLVV